MWNKSRGDRRLSRGRIFFRGFLLVLLAYLVFQVSPFIYDTPQSVYHRIWTETNERLYDVEALKDWKQFEHKYDDQIKTREDAVRFANEALQTLSDPYNHAVIVDDVTSVLRDEDNFAGIGITIGPQLNSKEEPVLAPDGKPMARSNSDGHPLIMEVHRGGPAEINGLKPGDAIVEVNGAVIKNISMEHLVSLIRKPVGTQLVLRVKSGGNERTIVLATAKVNLPAVEALMLPDNIGYIKFNTFGQFDSKDEMVAALTELDSAQALILDLRGNPGGYVHHALSVASLFIEEGVITTLKYRERGDPAHPVYRTDVVRVTKTEQITETTFSNDTTVHVSRSERAPYMLRGRKVIIIADRSSASASEMFSGALKDNGVATMVGDRTHGKGIGQSSGPILLTVHLQLTTLHYYTPSGHWPGDARSADRPGVATDIRVAPKRRFYMPRSEDDNVFETAHKHLRKELGLQ